MITFSSEEELINYLMTSDFVDADLSPDELKDLLNKFRYYYRIQHSHLNRKDNEIERLNKKINSYENSVNILEKELEMNEFKYERIKTKKLSLKERLKGKIQE